MAKGDKSNGKAREFERVRDIISESHREAAAILRKLGTGVSLPRQVRYEARLAQLREEIIPRHAERLATLL